MYYFLRMENTSTQIFITLILIFKQMLQYQN